MGLVLTKNIIKIAILLFITCTNLLISADADVLPYYINSLRRYGIGYTQVQSPVNIRNAPNGDIIETLNFDFKTGETTCLVNNKRCSQDEVFSVFKQEKKLAFLTTMDEGQNHSYVCFNQTEAPICGWVEENSNNKFYGWVDFFEYWGKKYGIYLFKDVQKTDRFLYSAPVKQTNTTGVLEFPKYIAPWLVRGNWVLVKVHDFNNQMKTGWLNFRGNDGKLRVFVKF